MKALWVKLVGLLLRLIPKEKKYISVIIIVLLIVLDMVFLGGKFSIYLLDMLKEVLNSFTNSEEAVVVTQNYLLFLT